MRKIGLFALASVMLLPTISKAEAADNAGSISYKDGIRLETPDFDMKINVQLQPRFTYEDNDQEGREEAGLDDSEDTAGFNLRRARLIVSGNWLKKQFSYKLQNDFRSQGGGGELKDAYIQWNNPDANVRAGQFKVPFSRQENASSSELSFIDRTLVNDFFAPSRQIGAMVHGDLSKEVHYYIGSYNGESDGEGINKAPVDNKLAVDAALTATFGDYGSRGSEGDHRADNSSTGFTTGAAVIYSQGEGDPVGTDTPDNFDRFDLNVDAGMRTGGLDVQAEAYYSSINLDSVDGDAGEADVFGFYGQVGYMITPVIELAGRFGYLEPDKDVSALEDQEEYNLVVSYFIHGHDLKIQTGVTYEVSNYSAEAGGADLTDFRVETQLTGYF